MSSMLHHKPLVSTPRVDSDASFSSSFTNSAVRGLPKAHFSSSGPRPPLPDLA